MRKRNPKPKRLSLPGEVQPIPPQYRALLSTRSAAELLDCSDSLIRWHIRAGNIATVSFGADKRIPIAEIKRIARHGLPPIRRTPAMPVAAEQPQEGVAIETSRSRSAKGTPKEMLAAAAQVAGLTSDQATKLLEALKGSCQAPMIAELA